MRRRSVTQKVNVVPSATLTRGDRRRARPFPALVRWALDDQDGSSLRVHSPSTVTERTVAPVLESRTVTVAVA
ncbi:MAG: hypothetical protein ACO3VG_04795, partial [Nitriliruptoraceae bacterium]